MKKLYKSNTDSIISGLLGGIAEYYAIDASILRLGFVLLAVLTGFMPGLIFYIIAVLIVPDKPYMHTTHHKTSEVKEDVKEEVKETLADEK